MNINIKKHIAIFGGTFNPPTLGHMKMIDEILKVSKLSNK